MNLKDEIQICMAIHDPKGTYCKYAGVAILSIVENTSNPVRFHLLHDGTISEQNKMRLQSLTEGHAATIDFHEVDMSQLAAGEETYHRITIGTMFRLRIFDVLPKSVRRVIQMDVDLMVHLDIAALWNLDLQGKLLAACKDTGPARKVICEKGLLPYEEYVNVGVVLWDVEAIRKKQIDFYKESNAFFRRVPDVRLPDEEAVNVIFRGKILPMDLKYNYMAVWTRTRHERLGEKIYHYGGDVPRANGHFMVDRLFASYLRKTPWWTPRFVAALALSQEKECAQRAWTCAAIRQAVQSHRLRVFWGVGGAIHPFIMDRFDLRPDDIFVDSDERKWGTSYQEYEVESPAVLREWVTEKPIVIVTIYRFHEVRSKLQKLGYQENVDFFDGKALLSEDLLASYFGERIQPWDGGGTDE